MYVFTCVQFRCVFELTLETWFVLPNSTKSTIERYKKACNDSSRTSSITQTNAQVSYFSIFLFTFLSLSSKEQFLYIHYSVCLAKIKKPAYFTIQLIFVTIHRHHCTLWYYNGFHYTISANFYFYLQYFQQKKFQF